jgi:hypothetical protein
MSRERWLVVVVVVATGMAVGAGWPAVAVTPAGMPADESTRNVVVERLDRMPLLFVPEEVSPSGAAGFVVRGRETSIWLSQTVLAYRLHGPADGTSNGATKSWVVALDLVGATPGQLVGENPLPTKVSYFKGPKERWRTGLPSYGSVRYREPWPGVDLVVSGTAGELESTFVVRPGANASAIRLAYRGASAVRLEADGSLVVDTPRGEIREQAPFAYQDVDGRRVEVAAAFELEEASDAGRHAYRFRLGEYDRTRELVVDPVTLIYCGYIGGSGIDSGSDIEVDTEGNIYVVGSTRSDQASFPVTVGPDLTYNGSGDWDAFVAKVNANGTALEYCGYIGGSGWDTGLGIAVDTGGNAYVTGDTESSHETFPVTVGPVLTFSGGNSDAFVARINAIGTGLDYCGYVGGTGNDHGYGIAVDDVGRAYVAGSTDSTDVTFPVNVGPDLTYNDDDSGNDGFVARIVSSGTAFDYCGYIGGPETDEVFGIAVDAAGNAYVTGYTESSETTFPVAVGPDLTYNGARDAFVAKISADGSGLDYCGYIGGSDRDVGYGIAVDAAGHAYLGGATSSRQATFPVIVGPDLSFNGGPDDQDAFVAKINADGTVLDYCGYIGGSGGDTAYALAVDIAGNAYVSGVTWSTEATFPVTVGPDLTYNSGPDSYV